ncbi:hypothetical protein KFL_002960110 [Klebsormidium nitens]|uniref:Uncharacterized protein n=1 Tax=Klebsormidium nitens TaxID=105231 RepID=A0A1Y1ICW7_KLENI|nr:hypothetical protein KFL_002960110 [Klebsormidium nitens]|eukprot:GAQ86556.1 hypothetical protein KFL_002960110 [Klebsormidium nitens]
MGLNSSVLRPKGTLISNTEAPEEQGKEALPLPAKSIVNQDGTRSDASATSSAPPSVVIPWVFREVAESLSETDYLRQSVMLEKHAARLRLCWAEYGADFPKTFAAELLRLPDTDLWETPAPTRGWEKNKKSQLLNFLLKNFAGEKGDAAKLRVRRGSEELWRPLMSEIERLSVTRGPDWTSPEAARFRAKNVKEKVAKVEKEAAKAVLEAKKRPIKASLKPAP